MWNGKVVSVQTFCVSADYHTSHKIGFRLGEEYPHVLSCILPLPKKTTICVRDLHSVTMAWSSLELMWRLHWFFYIGLFFPQVLLHSLDFSVFANCDVFWELGQLWQFWKQVRAVCPMSFHHHCKYCQTLISCTLYWPFDKELKLSFILTVIKN